MRSKRARRRGPTAGGANNDLFSGKRGRNRERTLPDHPAGVNHRAAPWASPGFGSIEILEPERLLLAAALDPGLLRWLGDFIDGLPQSRPLCATCATVFTQAIAPALWVLTRHPGNEVYLSGVCAQCAAMTNAEIARAVTALLGARVVDPAHVHPGGSA
jgi:hypothetical protein